MGVMMPSLADHNALALRVVAAEKRILKLENAPPQAMPDPLPMVASFEAPKSVKAGELFELTANDDVDIAHECYFFVVDGEEYEPINVVPARKVLVGPWIAGMHRVQLVVNDPKTHRTVGTGDAMILVEA